MMEGESDEYETERKNTREQQRGKARVGIGWSETVHRANLGDLSGIVDVQEEDGEEGERGSEVGVFSFFLLISQINTSIHGKVMKVKGDPPLSFLSLWYACVKMFQLQVTMMPLLVMCPKS